jgi:hypothetical protein
MCSTVQCPVQRNLQQPILNRALGPIKKEALPVEMKKALLDHIFGLAPVTHYSESNSKDQPCIPVKQNFQRRRIVCLQAMHGFIITWFA